MNIHPLKPDFERLQKTLFGAQTERVPLFELAISSVVKEAFINQPVLTIHDEIEFAKRAGYDYIKVSPKFDMIPASNTNSKSDLVTPIAGSDLDRSWHTSGKGMITSIDDFERFHWPQMADVDFSMFDSANKQLPDTMGIVGQYGDIFTWTWDFMGFETFSFALVEDPELITLIFDTIGNFIYNLFKTMAEYEKVGALFYSDDIAINTGLFVAPSVLRHYLFPWVEKIGKLCHNRNIPFIYHSDGVLWDVFDDLEKCGVNAIHPIEPQAMNIVEVKEKVGDRFCLCGNVDVDLLSRGTVEQVREYVKMLLTQVAPGGGYCLGSGNSVPEYVKVDNYRTMVQHTTQFGHYPIELA